MTRPSNPKSDKARGEIIAEMIKKYYGDLTGDDGDLTGDDGDRDFLSDPVQYTITENYEEIVDY